MRSLWAQMRNTGSFYFCFYFFGGGGVDVAIRGICSFGTGEKKEGPGRHSSFGSFSF